MSVPAALTGMVLIWATTPLAIKWSSEAVGVMFSLSSRMLLGMLLCWILLALMRIPFQWHRQARLTYLASGLGMYFAMVAVYWGAQHISSGLVSVVYGLLPMLTFFFASLVLGESLWQPSKLLGAVMGFAGLLVTFNPQDGFAQSTWLGVILVLASVASHALSMVTVQRIGAGLNALTVTAGSLSVAVPLYLLTWWVFDAELPTQISERALGSIFYLAVVGSVFGFVLFFYALKHVSASSIAVLTLITPVLALSLGHWLNDEVLQQEILFGAGLVLMGLAMHNWGDRLLIWARTDDESDS